MANIEVGSGFSDEDIYRWIDQDEGRGGAPASEPDRPLTPEDGIALQHPQDYGRIALSAA